MTLDELGLKPRTLKSLKNPLSHIHIRTGERVTREVPYDVNELVKFTPRHFLKIKGFAAGSLLDLTTCLQRHGYELARDDTR